MSQIIKTSNVEQALKDLVFAAMKKAFPKVPTPEPLIALGKSCEYQCNNAMGLAKLLTKADPPLKMTPEAIGQELKQHLAENDLIATFEPTSRGFIEMTVGAEWAAGMVHQVLAEGVQPPVMEKQRILVDFSSPNIAKEMHAGHLRSTIIGECICRLLEFCQHDVSRINHVGDWGTSFGMLILYLKRNYPDYATTSPDISDLTGFYKSAKDCFDADPEFKEQARYEVVKLQALEPESIQIWQLICDVSRKAFDEIYVRLGAVIEERGESFYNPIIPKVIDILEQAGKIELNDGAKIIVSKELKPLTALEAPDMTKLANQHLAMNTRAGASYHPNLLAAMRKAGVMTGEEGAEVVVLSKKETKPWAAFDLRMDLDKLMAQLAPLYKGTVDPLFLEVFEEHQLIDNEQGLIKVPRFAFPLMALKSDGGYTYDTTDIAGFYHRFVMEKMNRVIISTDVGQFEHFNMVLQVAKDMQWMKEGDIWQHAGFGLVLGPDGKKFKTRSGDTVKLKDLLDEAVERSLKILREREEGDRAQGHTEEEMACLSSIIGMGAVKYFDLKQTRTSDYAFDYDKMLSMAGNTAVFLLYQYARLVSIERKAETNIEDLRAFDKISLDAKEEKALAMCAFRFQSVILRTADDLMPHHLTDYAYELVTAFSTFFQNCRVIGDPQQESRLCLVELTRMTLKKTLDILNIEVVDRM